MSDTIETIDVTNDLTLHDLLAELRGKSKPCALRVDGNVVAIVTPVGETNGTQAEPKMTNTVDATDITNEPSIRKIVARLWEGHDPVTLGENGQVVAFITGAIDFSGLREVSEATAQADERGAEREPGEVRELS